MKKYLLVLLSFIFLSLKALALPAFATSNITSFTQSPSTPQLKGTIVNLSATTNSGTGRLEFFACPYPSCADNQWVGIGGCDASSCTPVPWDTQSYSRGTHALAVNLYDTTGVFVQQQRASYILTEQRNQSDPWRYMPDDNQLIKFTSSNGDFERKLNNFYDNMLKGKLNVKDFTDDTFFDSNRIFPLDWSLWFEWQAMSTAFSKDDFLRSSTKNALLGRTIHEDGFVYNGGSEEEIGWIFPNYQDGGNKSAGWEFNEPNKDLLNGWSAAPWDQNLASVDLSDPSDPPPHNFGITMTSSRSVIGPAINIENLNIDPFNCPIIRIRMMSRQADKHMRIDWHHENESWSPDGSQSIGTEAINDGTWNTYNLLVYKNPKWNGTIKALSVYPSISGSGNGAGIDYIRCAYDSRHSIDNTAYILGAWQYYMWTKDETFLTSMFPKLTKVINYLGTEFQGNSLGYLQNPWWGHEGTSGIDLSTNPFTRIPGRGMGSNWQDGLPFGGADGYLSSYYYRALKAMADLDPANRQTYLNKADFVKQTSDSKFWNTATGRFTPVIDANNQSHDYGYTFANLEMLYNGLGDTGKANSIFNWLDGDPNIYKPVFAPRLNTENNDRWWMWQMVEGDTGKNPPGLLPQWNRQIQNGGAALYYSYYDVMARLKYKGTDNAFNRFNIIVNWWDEVRNSGGVRKYYENGAGKNLLSQFWRLQGCGTDGGIGLDCEFPENVIVPTAFLYGFLGIEPKIDGLHINPHLPNSLSYAGVNNIYHWNTVYNIKVDKNISEVAITPTGGVYQVNVPADKETVIANGSCIQCFTPSPTPTSPAIASATPTTPIPGDITGPSGGGPDGVVNIYDYNKLIGDFGKSNSPADIDGSGMVDIYDYNILIGNFGRRH